MPNAKATIVVNVSPDDFFDVITDYENYPDFIPETQGAEIVKESKPKADGSRTVEVKYDVKVMKSFSYTLKHEEKRPKKMSWSQLDGPFKENEGSWTLKDLGDGQTEANYEISMAFGFLVPGAISNALIGKSLPKLLEQFKGRAEKAASGKASKKSAAPKKTKK